jgi:hypothetical protein
MEALLNNMVTLTDVALAVSGSETGRPDAANILNPEL